MSNNISVLPLTVTQLNNQVKTTLYEEYQNLKVVGEINNLKKYSSGHLYFILKDATSKISCVMFNHYYEKSNLDLQDGDEVILSGDITLYVPNGNYQFSVKSIDPKEKKGDIYKEYEKLKKKLNTEGLFDDKYKKTIPQFPQKIAIITSLDGSVIKDIVSIAKRRSGNIDLIISPSSVQGIEAYKEVIYALNQIKKYDKINKIDLVIIARGGGSFEDLHCFNNEKLARKVFDFKIPIISAIGHETDFTILDFVSDLRAATPSEATELSIPDDDETTQALDLISDKIFNKIILGINKYKENHNLLNSSLEKFNPKLLLDNYKIKVLNIKDKMDNIQKNIHKIFNSRIKYYDKLLYHNNPYNILDKGFVMISGKNKKFIKTVENLNVNQEIDIKFKDGLANAIIQSLEQENEKK